MKTFPALLFLTLIICACSNDREANLTIATSANMQFAMVEVEKAFELETGLDIEVILGSSGKLTSQIIAGAPFDLFLAADSKYPQRVYEEGLAYKAPQTYAYGKLVVWSSLDSIAAKEADYTQLKIAMANPKTAPYGLATMEYLKSAGDLEEVKDNLVYGESISQVNQFLLSGAAQAGFTSKSSMYSEAFKNIGTWTEVPEDTYELIAQALIILNNRPEMKSQAQAFYDFILSDSGQEILKSYGYQSVN